MNGRGFRLVPRSVVSTLASASAQPTTAGFGLPTTRSSEAVVVLSVASSGESFRLSANGEVGKPRTIRHGIESGEQMTGSFKVFGRVNLCKWMNVIQHPYTAATLAWLIATHDIYARLLLYIHFAKPSGWLVGASCPTMFHLQTRTIHDFRHMLTNLRHTKCNPFSFFLRTYFWLILCTHTRSVTSHLAAKTLLCVSGDAARGLAQRLFAAPRPALRSPEAPVSAVHEELEEAERRGRLGQKQVEGWDGKRVGYGMVGSRVGGKGYGFGDCNIAW